MKLSRHASASTVLALAAAVVGCAHTSTASTATPPATEQVVTGSRLPQPVDPQTGHPVTPSIVRTYETSDLLTTGRPQLGGAVQVLDPAVRP